MSNRRGRSLFLVVLLIGLTAFGGIWYAAAGVTSGSDPDFGGVYMEGAAGAPARINPLFARQNATDEALASLIFAGLTSLDDHGVAFPDLADTWTVSPDGRVYVFTLRQGLVWQDGAPLTADDVIFTYDLLRAPGLKGAPPLAQVLLGAQFSRVDARNIRIELAQPFAPLPAYLTLGILPAHLLQSVGAVTIFDAPFNQRPIGSGPYKLEVLDATHAVLVANSAYHFGQPFVQRIEMRFFRDDGAVLSALRAEEINGAFFRNGLTPTDLSELEQRKDLVVSRLPANETTYVYLNLRNELFQDRRVRQALLYAIDRDAIVTDIFGDQVVRADSPITPGNWAYEPSLARYGTDANIAGLLLDEAGWRLNTANVRRKGDKTLAFTLATSSDPVRVAVAQKIAEAWGQLGITVTIATSGSTTLVRDLLEPRTYEAALFGQVGDADPDPYLQWHSTRAVAKGGNLSSLSDERFDKLLSDARQMATQARRRELYLQFQELFAQEVPAIPLYTSEALYVQTTALKGVRNGVIAGPGGRFWQVQQWFMKTR